MNVNCARDTTLSPTHRHHQSRGGTNNERRKENINIHIQRRGKKRKGEEKREENNAVRNVLDIGLSFRTAISASDHSVSHHRLTPYIPILSSLWSVVPFHLPHLSSPPCSSRLVASLVRVFQLSRARFQPPPTPPPHEPVDSYDHHRIQPPTPPRQYQQLTRQFDPSHRRHRSLFNPLRHAQMKSNPRPAKSPRR